MFCQTRKVLDWPCYDFQLIKNIIKIPIHFDYQEQKILYSHHSSLKEYAVSVMEWGSFFFLSYYYKINHCSGYKDQIWHIAPQDGWVRYTGYQCFLKWQGMRNCFVYLKVLESWYPDRESKAYVLIFFCVCVSFFSNKETSIQFFCLFE